MPCLKMHVEAEHVHKVYSQIAEHFSDTRHKPWPRIADFLLQQPPGSLIADVGCGNGKYLGVNPLTHKLGSDICPELVAIARTRGHEVAVCDCLNLPYRSNQFDAAICIAVVHHLSTEERRLAALRELVRIVRSGGKILVYVWAMEQERKKFESQDVMVPWHMQPKYSGEQKRQPKTARENKPKRKQNKKSKRKEKSAEDYTPGSEQRLLDDSSEASPFSCELLGISLSDEEEGDCVCDGGLGASDTDTTRDGKSIADMPTTDNSVVQDRLGNDDLDSRADSSGSAGSMKTLEAGGSEAAGMRKEQLVESDNTSTAKPNLAELGYRTFNRYYHVFRRRELARLFAQVPGVQIREEFYDHENWCVLAEKLSPKY